MFGVFVMVRTANWWRKDLNPPGNNTIPPSVGSHPSNPLFAPLILIQRKEPKTL